MAFFDASNIKRGNKCVIAGSGVEFPYDEEVSFISYFRFYSFRNMKKNRSIKVFCSGKVLYAGQALGLVVARSQMKAIEAAKLVQIKYKDLQKPVLTIKEAMKYPERIMDHSNFGPPNSFDSGDLESNI